MTIQSQVNLGEKKNEQQNRTTDFQFVNFFEPPVSNSPMSLGLQKSFSKFVHYLPTFVKPLGCRNVNKHTYKYIYVHMTPCFNCSLVTQVNLCFTHDTILESIDFRNRVGHKSFSFTQPPTALIGFRPSCSTTK
jgi:hypothetical protein